MRTNVGPIHPCKRNFGQFFPKSSIETPLQRLDVIIKPPKIVGRTTPGGNTEIQYKTNVEFLEACYGIHSR